MLISGGCRIDMIPLGIPKVMRLFAQSQRDDWHSVDHELQAAFNRLFLMNIPHYLTLPTNRTSLPMTADKFFRLFSKSSFSEHKDRCDILSSYLDRLNLWPTLFRRYQEEEILKIVPISQWLEEERQRFLGDSTLESVLQEHQWSLADFDHHLSPA